MADLVCSQCGQMVEGVPDGGTIRRRRLEGGLSLRAFAAQLGISIQYASDIERGYRTSASQLRRMDHALQASGGA